MMLAEVTACIGNPKLDEQKYANPKLDEQKYAPTLYSALRIATLIEKVHEVDSIRLERGIGAKGQCRN